MQATNERPLHERLADLQAIGLTQNEIAEYLGVRQPTVSNLLKPLAPGMKTRRYSAGVMEGAARAEAVHSVLLARLAA
jgi:transcriptional regulator with XRE-family HTH domain